MVLKRRIKWRHIGKIGGHVGDLGAKYGDLGAGNLCLGSLDAMGCLRVWVGWDFGAESGGFGVFWGGACVRTAAVRGSERVRPNGDT